MSLRTLTRISLLLIACFLFITVSRLPSQANASPRERTTARTATFDDGMGNLLVNIKLRLLCYNSPTPGAPVADINAVTDGAGHIGGLPDSCTYVAALKEIYAQPSGKPGRGPAYRVYSASFAPNNPLPVDITATIHVRKDWTLTLFDVSVSLAWDPAPSDSTLDEVRGGLNKVSSYLYDLTEGQMAFGPLAISSDGRNWNSADIRLLSANDYRPAAYVGGISPARVTYDTALPGALGRTSIFAPGAIYLGRSWNGADASDPIGGAWNQEDAWRTLGHEWSHYALFLFDEYQESTGRATYCICNDLPSVTGTPTPGICGGWSADLVASVMAYHYTAGEFWQPDPSVHGEPAACADTAQVRVHGEADWKTLLRWNTIQHLPAGIDPVSWPAALTAAVSPGVVGDLFGRSAGYVTYMPAISASGTAPAPTGSFTVNTSLDIHGRAAAGFSTQTYLLIGAPSTPQRILPEGRLRGDPAPGTGYLGSIQLLGVPPQSHLRLSAERYTPDGTPGGRFTYPIVGGADTILYDGIPVTAGADGWSASLDASYSAVDGFLTEMTLTLTSNSPSLSVAPLAQLCDIDQSTGCPSGDWRQTMAAVPGHPDTWQAVFTASGSPSELPLYGVIRVTAQGVGEIIRWFQVGGGVGPAHIDADAPLRDGPLMVDSSQVLDGPCNKVVIMPAANQQALNSPLPTVINNPKASFLGVVGQVWDVDVLMPGTSPGSCDPNQNGLLPAPVYVTLFYSQEIIDQLGISEGQLHVLHYSSVNGVWMDVSAPGGADPNLNWVSSIPLNEAGIFAVGWTN